MWLLPKIFARSDNDTPSTGSALETGNEKSATDNKAATTARVNSSDYDYDSSDEPQPGVEKMEAVAKLWSRNHIIIAYVLLVYLEQGNGSRAFVSLLSLNTNAEKNSIWVIYFMDSMHSSMSFSLTPYVTSAFQKHGLTATTSVFSNLIGGLVKLPLAKVLDIWGRPQGFALMVSFLVVGLVMMAACQNVETYAAAQVFYWIG